MYIKELGYNIKAVGSEAMIVKDVDEKAGIVVGYFSHFNSKDADGDIILKGAYAKTIREQGPEGSGRIKHLLDHNRQNAVAKLLKLEEDEIGLRYESKAGTHNAGQDWLKMCQSGIITEHSVGIQIIKGVNKADGNHVSEVSMGEGSSLQFWGANSQTPIIAIKNYKVAELTDLMKSIEREIRNGKYSDEAFDRLEIQLKAVNKHLLSISKLDTTEPDHNDETTLPGFTKKDFADAVKEFTQKLNSKK